jgi:hypothetical protein
MYIQLIPTTLDDGIVYINLKSVNALVGVNGKFSLDMCSLSRMINLVYTRLFFPGRSTYTTGVMVPSFMMLILCKCISDVLPKRQLS